MLASKRPVHDHCRGRRPTGCSPQGAARYTADSHPAPFDSLIEGEGTVAGGLRSPHRCESSPGHAATGRERHRNVMWVRFTTEVTSKVAGPARDRPAGTLPVDRPPM